MKKRKGTPVASPSVSQPAPTIDLTSVVDAAAAAAKAAVPADVDVVVIVRNQVGGFRVSWGALFVDQAGWLLYRALNAIERLGM